MLLTSGPRGDSARRGRNLGLRVQGARGPHQAPPDLPRRRPEDAEACVCELTDPVGLSQPTVSHHLKILVDAGILTREQRGKWAYYRLVPDTLNTLAALIAPQPLAQALITS